MELRRGSDTALVYSLNFSPDSSFLCAASDKVCIAYCTLTYRCLDIRFPLIEILPACFQTSQSLHMADVRPEYYAS